MDVCLASWASFCSFVDVLWIPIPIFEALLANSDWLLEVEGPADYILDKKKGEKQMEETVIR
jgi:hypothetical protein